MDEIRKYQDRPLINVMEAMMAPGIYPLDSSKYWRLSDYSKIHEFGQTDKNSKWASWHCGACCDKWSHAEDKPYRLWVSSMFEAGETAIPTIEGDQAFVAYIGPTIHLPKNATVSRENKESSLNSKLRFLNLPP